MAVSIHEVAKASGCSIATVSRVFNQRPNVREEARKRVIESAKRLGYDPRLSARKDCVAILADCYDSISFGPYETMLIPALCREIAAKGLHMEIIPCSEIDIFHGKFFKGVVSLLYREENLAALKLPALGGKSSIVCVNNEVAELPSVCSNERQGIALAVEHLAKLGHKRIAIAVKDEGKNWCRSQRLAAYKECMEKLGLDFDESLAVNAPYPPGSMTETLLKLMRNGATAVLAADEALGISASHSLGLLGVKAPAELSLVSFEFKNVSVFCQPAQTTICQDYEGLARKAVETLLDESRKAREGALFMDYKLIERESAGKAPQAKGRSQARDEKTNARRGR